MGYHRAGFDDITGIDNKPQKRYPFKFIQADALEYLAEHGHEYDFIHASPPCQAYSIAALSRRNQGVVYDDLIGPVRTMLNKSGKHWIIENVVGAPMRADVILCGSIFGLPIARHRLFEFSFEFPILVNPCNHNRNLITICGHGTPSHTRNLRARRGLKKNVSVDEKRAAMEIEWMNREELSQAIPPAYTEFIVNKYCYFPCGI